MRRTSRASSTRSSLGCSGSGSSPISSRNSVPPSASSNAPARARSAPVNAALLVAEQLGLEQVGRDGAAVDDDQRSGGARARLVNRLAQRVLAGAGLAFDQHGDVGGGDASGEREQAPHRRRSPPQPAEAFGVGERQLDRFVERIEAHLGVPERPASRRAARRPRAPRRPRCGCRWSTRDRAAAAPCAVMRMTQWLRDTVGSVSRSCAPSAPPIRISSSIQRHGLPLVGALEDLQAHLGKAERARAGERPRRRVGRTLAVVAHRDSPVACRSTISGVSFFGSIFTSTDLAPELWVFDRRPGAAGAHGETQQRRRAGELAVDVDRGPGARVDGERAHGGAGRGGAAAR